MSRATEIGKIIREWKAELDWPVEEWGDEVWEGVAECIDDIYIEDWFSSGKKETLEEEEDKEEKRHEAGQLYSAGYSDLDAYAHS